MPVASTGSAVCFHNADMLVELDTEAPQTWEDVREATNLLAAERPEALTLVMPSGPDRWLVDACVLTMATQPDPGFFDEVRHRDGAWNSSAYVRALTRFGELYADGTLQRSALDLGYGEAMNAFHTGKAVILCNGSREAALLRADLRAAYDIACTSIGAMPVPADGPRAHTTRSFRITWGIPRRAENPVTAVFIAFATQDAGVDIRADDLTFLSTASGWEPDPSVLGDDRPAADGFQEVMRRIREAGSDRNNVSAFSDSVGGYALEAAQGRRTAREAVDRGRHDLERGLSG